jgi:hypothetical protein
MKAKGYSMTDASGYIKSMGLYNPQKKKRKPSERGALIKKVMEDEKLTMIEASKYIKAKNLYKPEKAAK